MKKLFSFLFFLLLMKLVDAQTIQGKVIDAKTAEPISFVSLGIVGTNTATVTNENGEFIIKVEKLPSKIKFSHVSYYQLETSVLDLQNVLTIKLEPAAINLAQVVIRPDEGKNLLRSALEKAQQYANRPFYANAFYRQLTSTDHKPTEIHELFYDLKWNVKLVQGWQAKQSRFAEINDPSKFSLSNQSFLTFAFAGYLLPEKRRRYVSIKYLDDYEIEVDKYIEQENQSIAVVTCKQKKTNKNSLYINSTYYIGVKDLKVYRLENKIFNLPFELSPNLVFKFPPIAETVATFNGNGHPIPVLESISTKLYLALTTGSRQLNSIISSLLMVIDVDDQLKNQQFRNLNSEVKDKKVIDAIKYNAEFWKNNPIVKQTTLEDAFIKMMESKQAFGTMTNP